MIRQCKWDEAKSHQFLILAVEEREVQTQLLNCLLRPIDRSSTGASELHNGILAFMEEGRILVVDVDHGSWSSLIDRGCNEEDRKQRSLVGPRGQSKLTRHLANEFTADRRETRRCCRCRCRRGERKKSENTARGAIELMSQPQFRRPHVAPLRVRDAAPNRENIPSCQKGRRTTALRAGVSRQMSSYGSVLPSAARSILSSCRPAFRQGSMAPVLSGFYQQQLRGAKSNNPQAQNKGKKTSKAKTKGAREFKQRNLKDIQQFALCDAMRYGLGRVRLTGPFCES